MQRDAFDIRRSCERARLSACTPHPASAKLGYASLSLRILPPQGGKGILIWEGVRKCRPRPKKPSPSVLCTRVGGGGIGRAETLANARAIVEATHLPVSADLENGFGDEPEACAETIRAAS